MTNGTRERRKYIRLDTVFPIEFQVVEKEGRRPISELREGFTRNIGKGGMGIFARTLKEQDKEFFNFVPNETQLKLIINIPLDKGPVDCFATVEWIEKEPGPLVDTYRFGVSYDFINEIEYEKILSYVRWLHVKPKLMLITIALLIIAVISSLIFIFKINERRIEGEKELMISRSESKQQERIKEEAEQKVSDIETTLVTFERKYKAVQAALKKLAEDKNILEKRSKLREEDKTELQYQFDELTREKELLEERIETELIEADEAGVDLPDTEKGVIEIAADRLRAEDANYNKFRELILNEKIQSLSAYVSSHRSSIYHAAGLFALAELRYKYGERTLARVTYIQVIEIYPQSKYALYASHRLEQLTRNYRYEHYTLKYFYDNYSLPELFDYRDIDPYIR